MVEVKNILLLCASCVIYFTALAALFRYRRTLGIGAFFCALGVMHFIETYLASIFYVRCRSASPPRRAQPCCSPASSMMLLLVYIREDAAVVRQPIYGLLIGNLLMVGARRPDAPARRWCRWRRAAPPISASSTRWAR